jgi:hypothetical protein
MLNTLHYSIRKQGIVALALTPFLFLTPAIAAKVSVSSSDYRTPVVELYTSEGCSSCPRADAWISKLGDTLSDEFHAVPLAFHVDYWNYLGWEDPFSRSEFTTRQQELAANNRQHNIYTPELAVSGRETRGTTAVVQAIRNANTELAEVMITMDLIAKDGNRIAAALNIDNANDDAELYIAVYENDISREIGAGENRGRTLHHDFVVRHWVRATSLPAGPYQGSHWVNLNHSWERQNLGVAAVVVERSSGKTLQAVSAPLAELFEDLEDS